MFTGFQLDSESPRLPHGVRIIIALTAEGEDPFAIAITPIGVISNYVFTRDMLDEDNTRPNPQDVITVEYTPESLAQRHIIQLPEQQRILIGNLPDTFTFDIYVERKFRDDWKTTNRVLAVTDGHEFNLFQAKEFTKEYVPRPIVIASAEPAIRPEPEIIFEPAPVPEVIPEPEPIVVPEPVVIPEPEPEPAPVALPEATAVVEPDPVPVVETETEPSPEVPEVRSQEADSIPVTPEKVVAPKVEKVKGPSALTRATDFSRNLSSSFVGKVAQIQWRERAKNFFIPKSFVNLRKRVVIVIDVIVVFFALIIFTPLGLVHPNQPEPQSSSIVITWPSHNPNVGDEVVTSVIDQAGAAYIYIGTVETKSGDLYLLRNGENYVQVDSSQLQGKVLVSIPALGRLF